MKTKEELEELEPSEHVVGYAQCRKDALEMINKFEKKHKYKTTYTKSRKLQRYIITCSDVRWEELKQKIEGEKN